VLRALIAAMVAALAIAACGGSSSTGSRSAGLAVQRALVATQNRAYTQTFTEKISLDTSGLPSAEAARLTSISGTIAGTADVTNSRNFHIAVTLRGVKVYVRAVNGQLSVSQDGVNYQPAPSSTAKLFSQIVSLGPGVVNHIGKATSLGTAQVSGQTVSRYSATIPGSAVAPVFSALNVNFGSPGAVHFLVDVSRSSGLPIKVSDVESASFDLSKLKRPGVTGSFSVTIASVRSFRYG
jgi:hypothetical protein